MISARTPISHAPALLRIHPAGATTPRCELLCSSDCGSALSRQIGAVLLAEYTCAMAQVKHMYAVLQHSVQRQGTGVSVCRPYASRSVLSCGCQGLATQVIRNRTACPLAPTWAAKSSCSQHAWDDTVAAVLGQANKACGTYSHGRSSRCRLYQLPVTTT